MKEKFRRSIEFMIVGILCTLVCITGFPNAAFSQNDEEPEEEEVIPEGIPPLSKPVSLLGIPMAVYPFNERGTPPKIRQQDIVEIKVQFEDKTEGGSGLNINEDFLPLTTSAITSGLALFQESGANPDTFNFTIGDPNNDNPIDLLTKPVIEEDPIIPGKFTVTFTPRPGSSFTRITSLFNDEKPDFYVVGRTSLQLMQGDVFEVSIPPNGITIKDQAQTLPKNTLYEDRFPGDAFADLDEEFTLPAVFEGDIVQLLNVVVEENNSNRIDINSEPTTILGLDFVGRPDVEYFLEEVRVNWIGLNIAAVGKLLASFAATGYTGGSIAGLLAASPGGTAEQVVFNNPPFFFSPWFYNAPTDPETGEILTTTRTLPSEDVIEYPMTMPVDNMGIPLEAFSLGMDDIENHVTSYVAYGPRQPNSGAVFPRVVTQDILKSFQSDSLGGIFLYRERGGVRGKYDPGVDNLIKLDPSKFKVETFEIDPEQAQELGSPIRQLLRRFLPGQYGGNAGKEIGPFLFGDDNLATALLGVSELPDPPEEGIRPPLGSLECYVDPDCLFFDMMINVLRPYLGLTEGQIRYLFEYTEGNGRTNMEELFTYNLVQGFSFVMPVARSNALSDLKAPETRSAQNAGADIYLGIQTSNKLRNLDSFVPFIRPSDIKIGTNVTNFTKGQDQGVNSFRSVASIGFGRRNTSPTYAMIGRPRPRFNFQDFTQPGEGIFASNNNILFDSTQSSPPKPVIGINAVDFGQNPTLVDNHATIENNLLDNFLTQSTVFGEMQIEFLPGPRNLVFNPLILGVVPNVLDIDVRFSRLVNAHNISLYQDDDTPVGNGLDDDGDGLVDEELYNLQDDDGDGLIDEDLGDGTPRGTNGVFDSNDQIIPYWFDSFGSAQSFGDASYVFPPNSAEKYQPYIDALQANVDPPLTVTDGGLMPLNLTEGSWFGELDLRALQYTQLETPRFFLYPTAFGQRIGTAAGPPYDLPDYNQGTLIQPGRSPGFSGGGFLGGTSLEPHTGLMDILFAVGLNPDWPYFPEDMFIEDPESGETTWMLNYVPEDGDAVMLVPDPEGDARRTFALTMANAFRFVNPTKGFVRFGRTPMVINVPGQDAQNPEGDATVPNPYTQFGLMLSIADGGTFSGYLDQVGDALSTAYDEAYTAIDEYNQAVADAEADADPETGEIEYPDPPEVIEVSISSPASGLGINEFVDQNSGNYSTNYMYQMQIPDEDSGPLAGSDLFVVLRADEQARVGESFRVRISSGERNKQLTVTDPDDGTETTVEAPEGGIGYHYYVETDYTAGNEAFRNVSKTQITTSEIVVRSLNVAPTIKFISPGPGVNQASTDFEFEIVFTAEDPDDVAQIELYVDDDSLDFDGTFIPGAFLREGFNSTFTLNLTDHIPDFDPTKRYYIYAKIDDGVNTPIYTYADGFIVAPGAIDDGDGDPSQGNTRVVTGDMEDFIDYVKLTRDGRIFSLGDTPSLPEIPLATDVIDMEVNPTFSGRIMVLVDGSVLGVGDLNAFLTRLQPNGEINFATEEIAFYKNSVNGGQLIEAPTEDQITIESARDVEVDFTEGAIYVLDGDGDMLFLGSNANREFYPDGMDLDLYRDMELAPDGSHIYFLTGNGMMNTAGNGAVGEWMNLIPEDKYRDMELITNGNAVTNVVIVNEDGERVILGENESKSSLLALQAEEPLPSGSIRQVKSLPGSVDSLILVEGSGQLHVLTNEELNLPPDTLIFSDVPGLEDDRVVDVETTNINLQTVVESVRDILDGIENENLEQVMSHVSANYKDRNGADAAGIRRSLESLFGFYELNTFAESRTAQNSFVIDNQGDTVEATVIIDFDGYTPNLLYRQPEVDTGSTSKTYQANLMAQILFSQTIRVREVGDGRFWHIDIYEFTNYGRQDDLRTSDDLEFEDMTILKRLPGNRRIRGYSPRSEVMDDPIHIHVEKDPSDAFALKNIIFEFRELTLSQDYEPPAMEVMSYTGSSLSFLQFNTVIFRFKKVADGSYELMGMNMRQILSENQEVTAPEETGDIESPLDSIDGSEIEEPFGFSFKDRGPVAAAFSGDSDLVISGDQFVTSNLVGAIMMLPEGTDIFAIDPKTYIQDFNRTLMRIGPFDPATQGGGGGEQSGYTASIIPGRAYLILTRDGQHYGFIQIPEDETVDDTSIMSFDYRYEDSFILPPGF